MTTLNQEITPVQVEFKEFEVNDPFFFNNRFWKKVADRKAEITHEVYPEEIGVVKTFLGNCLVNIVIQK